jgi:hypothetical protein
VVAEGERDTCAERRVFYRLISGLHTSISTHIAGDYLLDEATTKWGKSYVMMHERVLMHPERVQNLYFTFLFVLRALTKVCDVSVHILCLTIMWGVSPMTLFVGPQIRQAG